MLQNEFIKNCDAIVWISYEKDNQVLTNMTFFTTPRKNKVEPTSLGFKYNILLFRTPADADSGPTAAIIGDPKGYAENLGKLGYNGIMFKNKVKARKELKHLFEIILATLGFSAPQIKKAIKSTIN